MNALYIANVQLDPNEGIYKKIYAEASAIGNCLGHCDLILKEFNGSKTIDVFTGKESIGRSNIFQNATSMMKKKEIKVLYIRLMIPNVSLVLLMKKAKNQGIKVYYEIPTYPYYAEQFRSSRKKYRALAKILIDCIFSPFIYHNCNYMVVIRSNSNIKLKSKMIEITNGVNISIISEKRQNRKNPSSFNIVTVGTLYPYHGYDRVLLGLHLCKEQVNGVPVEFHVIGSSQTIDELEELSKKLELSRVYFHGVKTSTELNHMFDDYDVGLGCLALHRRNANIDTTLKVIEYYCRGLPVVTSGQSPYNDKTATIFVDDDDNPIDIGDIYNKWKCIPNDTISHLSKKARDQFDWNNIFSNLLNNTLKGDI